VEALTGIAGYEHLLSIREQLRDTASLLRAQESGVLDATRALTIRLKEQEERIASFEEKARGETAEKVLDDAESHNGHKLIVVIQDGMSPDELRSLAFQLRDRIGSGIGVLGSNFEGKAALLTFATSDLVEAGVSAGAITAVAARVVGGGGSRDPELSQAGGPRGDEVEAALEVARSAARAALQGA
jgi:alanyl-tRNA synthetase